MYNIDIPGIEMGKRNVKDLIVNSLAIEWPLTLKKLHNLLKNKYNVSVSCQAVYKALQEMTRKNIIIKNNKEYSLNLDWIKQLKTFSKKLEEAYIEKNPLVGNYLESGNGTQSFTLDNMFNLDKFLLFQIEKFLTKKEFEKIPCYSQWNFGWWPLFISREGYQVLKKIINPKRVYISIKDNSVVARFCSNFYSRASMNSKSGVDTETNFDFITVGDLIIQIYYPQTLIKKILSVFNKIKNLEEIDMDKIDEIFSENYEINLIILKNKNIAKILSDKVLGVFN